MKQNANDIETKVVEVEKHPTRKLKSGTLDPTDYENCVDMTDYNKLANHFKKC